MEEIPVYKRCSSIMVTMAALVIILTGVKFAEGIISPFLVALFVTAISSPAMFWLNKYNVPAGLSVSLIILTIILAGFVTTSIVSSSLHDFSANMPLYQERLQSITNSLAANLDKLGLHLRLDELKKIFNLGKVMGFIGVTFNHVLGTLTNIFLILMVVIFLLLELSTFSYKFSILSSDPEQTRSHMKEISGTINRYFQIKTLTSVLTALPIIIVLSLMGIDFPVLWGIVAFFLNFVPNIGSIIAAVPVILLALIQFGFLAAGQVVILYLVMNNVVGNFLEPKLMGQSLGLSTLVVFLSLVFWGWLLGPVGMFLSVPLTMTLKIIMDTDKKTRWISIMLSNDGKEA